MSAKKSLHSWASTGWAERTNLSCAAGNGRKARLCGVLAAVCLLAFSGVASSQDNLSNVGDAAVQNQWFTGSLEAPSPSLPKAGMVALEPYAIFINPTGAYDNGGHHYGVSDQANQFQSVLVFKYGITDRLTVEALPSVSHISSQRNHFTGVGDLPIELEYRFNDENSRTGWPSLTASFGVTLPTGDYERLSSASNGLGSGVYLLKEGLLFESLFDTADDHPVRIRVYGAAFEPLDHADIDGTSTYGTDRGFRGNVMPGVSFQAGIGAGYAFTQRWVLALDVLQNYGKSFRTKGVDSGGFAVRTRSASTASTAIAPAMEYNWSGSVGLIAGVEFTTAGRNTGSYVSPQIALAVSF